MSVRDTLRRRFAGPPPAVRAVVTGSGHAEERTLAWGALLRDDGWLVATSRGLRVVTSAGAERENAFVPWHEVAGARWSGSTDGGGSFSVVRLAEVEPGVQARLPAVLFPLADAGDLPAVVRRRVDETVVASQRFPLPGGGGVLLVSRRLPGQAAREWTVVFDDDTDRSDPVMRESARRRLADAVAAEQPD